MRAHVDMQDCVVLVPQVRSCLRFMSMYGAVCQQRTPDPTGRDADQGGKKGDGNTSDSRGKQRGDSWLNRRSGCDQGELRRREAMERRAATRGHHRRAKGRQSTSQFTHLPRRTYVSRRSTETGYMPTLAPTLTEASATTRRGRRGGVTLWSCHRDAMTRQVGESGGGSSGRWERRSRGCGTDCGTRSGSSSFRQWSCNKPHMSPNPSVPTNLHPTLPLGAS